MWYVIVLATDALDGLEIWMRHALMSVIMYCMVVVLVWKGGRSRETQQHCDYFVRLFDNVVGVQWELVLTQFVTVWLETWK